MSVFLGAIDKKEGYKSKRELNLDFKRLVQESKSLPKSLSYYESLPSSILGKTVKVKLPNSEKPFKTKVSRDYDKMFTGTGKYKNVYDKKFIIEILK